MSQAIIVAQRTGSGVIFGVGGSSLGRLAKKGCFPPTIGVDLIGLSIAESFFCHRGWDVKHSSNRAHMEFQEIVSLTARILLPGQSIAIGFFTGAAKVHSTCLCQARGVVDVQRAPFVFLVI